MDTSLPYRFEQTPLQLTVYVPFETKPNSKQLDIQFKGQFVSVKRKDSPDFILKVYDFGMKEESLFFINIRKGEISQPIKGNDSTWYIEDNNLVLVFEKKFKVWCSCVLKGIKIVCYFIFFKELSYRLIGDPEIDVTKIDTALLDGSDLTHEQQDQVRCN